MEKNIKIKGSNKAHYNCISCGKELTKDEYCMCDDLCKTCRREYYYKFDEDYIDRYGNNKIDNILVDKVKR